MNHCFTHITVAFHLRKGCIPATAACNKSRPASAGRALPGGNKHNATPEALAKGVCTRLGWDSNGKIIETNQLTINKKRILWDLVVIQYVEQSNMATNYFLGQPSFALFELIVLIVVVKRQPTR